MKLSVLIPALFLSVATIAQTQRSISVSGTATEKVNADQLRIVTGVNIEGDDAAELFEKSSTIMDAAIKYLNSKKKQCTFETDIIRLQSQSYYNSNANRPDFKSTQTLTIILTDFESYDEIINKLVSLGFNNIKNATFEISRPDLLKAEVRKQAILNAKQKAQSTASLLDVQLGELLTFSESGGGSNFRDLQYSNSIKFESSVSSDTHTLAAGQISFTVTVYVTYNIKEN